MGYLKDIETTRKQLNLYIDNYKHCLKACDVIKDVAKTFDGKVLNVRFKNALQEAFDKKKLPLYVSITDDEYNNIRVYFRNRSICLEHYLVYIKYDTDYIVNNYRKETDYIVEGRRINCERLCRLVDAHIDELKAIVEVVKRDTKNLEKIAKRYNEIQSEIKDFNSKTNYIVLQEFNAYIDVRF